jgi:hypothetical protein
VAFPACATPSPSRFFLVFQALREHPLKPFLLYHFPAFLSTVFAASEGIFKHFFNAFSQAFQTLLARARARVTKEARFRVLRL